MITACDKALKEKNETIAIQDLALKQERALLDTVIVDNARKDAQLKSWTRNPFIMVLLGVVGGLTLSLVASR